MGGSAHFFTYQLLTVINVVLCTSTLGGWHNQLQLVATGMATSLHKNQLQLVVISSVAVHPKTKISVTGCGLVASKKGQKAGLDQTLKH